MCEWSVYIHTAPEGKVYVGATSKPPKTRWNYGYGYRNSPFFKTIEKYGWNNIRHDVVASGLSESEAYTLEKKLISDYDSTNPEKGYNRATGGCGTWGVKISEETRQRLIDSHIGKKNPHTKEWNQKIREGNIGRKNLHVGVPRSEECKKKIGESHSIKVEQYDKNGVMITEYVSAREAERCTGVANQNISSCCRGKVKTAGGYVWKYKTNIKEEYYNE